MKNLIKLKNTCINDIINIIKKYNISFEEIAVAYINKFEHQFHEKEQYQFDNLIEYKHLFNENNQKILTKFTIIDNYIILD